jgi:predicted O-linked N-acetylglucosamine transferase (SPINDLY family)
LENKIIIDTGDLQEAFDLHLAGNETQAQVIYHDVLGLDINHPDFMYILANLAHSIGECETAVFLMNQAIQNTPARSQYYQSLGEIYRDLGKFNRALECFQKSIELDSARPDALVSRANLAHLQGKFNETEGDYLRALKLDANNEKALVGLGNLYKEQGKVEEAENCYTKSLALKSNPGLEIKSAFLLPVICDSKKSIQTSRDRLEKKLTQLKGKNLCLSDPYAQVGTTSFHLAYHGLSNKNIQETIASFYREICPELSWRSNESVKPAGGNSRITIGLISRFLHRHTIGYLNYGIIKHLNRERFQVKVFRFPGNEDDLSGSIQQAADEVIELPENLKKARRVIAKQALDILLYLDIGMDPLTYFLAYSRLAPVQCTTWGHVDTTGIPNMDYYLSSVHAEPQNAQQHYSERLYLMDRFPMYCYLPDLPEESVSREILGLPADHNLYVCPQSLFKFHPDFDSILKAILEKDPSGLLVLFEGKHPSWSELLKQRFSKTIPEVLDRIHFHPRLPRNEFLSMVSSADVILDTLHFNGGYTSLLCLGCGVPIVTMPGQFLRGRMTQALYKQIGLTECIVEDEQGYIDLAVSLAADKSRNRQLRRKIMTSSRSLFENIDAVHELEAFFEWSLKQTCKGSEYATEALNRPHKQGAASHEGVVISESKTDNRFSCQQPASSNQTASDRASAKVTIITPTYQRNPDIVQRNIACVRAQSYPHWRHIICSDGVFEKAVYELVFQEGDLRRTYCVAEKHYGDFANSVRHEMLTKHAETEFVLFYDDDNIILPNYLEKMIGSLEKTANGEQFAICQLMHFGPVIKSVGRPPVLLEGVPKAKYIDTLQVVARTKAMKAVGWLKNGYCSDGYTFEELGRRFSFVRVNECLALHM